MAKNVAQPLTNRVPIVNADGTPTDFFIRQWKNFAQGAGGLLDGFGLNDLADVDAPSPTNNQIIQYKTATQMWEAESLISGGGSGFYPSNIPVDIPTLADFTRLDAGAAIPSDIGRGITIKNALGAANRCFFRENVFPAPPFTRYLCMTDVPGGSTDTSTDWGRVGLMLRNSSNGRWEHIGGIYYRVGGDENVQVRQEIVNYPTLTGVAVAQVQILTLVPPPFIWFKIEVTATQYTFSFSLDGETWLNPVVRLFSAYLTAAGGVVDQVGFSSQTEAMTTMNQAFIWNYGANAPL